MRTNTFEEQILQPGDTYADLERAWERKFCELPETSGFNVEVSPTMDETFKIGGEFRENSSGEAIAFDGFESVDAALAWLKGDLKIDASDIEVLDE